MDYVVSLSKNLQSVLMALLLLLLIYYLINIGNKYVHINKRCIITKKHIMTFCFIVLGVIILFNFVKGKSVLKEVVLLIIYSVIISYVLNPIVSYLERKGIKRSISILLIYIVIIIIVILIIMTIVPEISREFKKLIDLIPNYSNKIYDIFNNNYLKYAKRMENLPKGFDGINKIFSENLNKLELKLLKYLRNTTNSMINIITKSFKLIIVPIISFYFLQDKEYFKKKLYMLIPKKHRKDTLRLCREIDSVLTRFIKGQIITSIIVGFLTMVGLLIIRIDYAVIIGLVVALFEIIPYFGPVVGVVLTVIFGLLDSPSKAIWGLLILMIVQQLENSVIAPKIVGESVGLHPVIVMIVVILGGSYFGVLGMILAVPVSAIVKILFSFVVDKVSEQ